MVNLSTLRLDGKTIHLGGVIPPDATRPCPLDDGAVVTCLDRGVSAFEYFLHDKRVTCAAGTENVQCRAGRSNVSEWLIRSGWVRNGLPANKTFSTAEAEARKAKLGLWK